MRGALVVDPEMFLLNEEGWGGGGETNLLWDVVCGKLLYPPYYGIPNPHSQLYALGINISFLSPLPCI